MLTINTRYVRRSPKGEETIAIPKTEEEVKYHTGLIAEGYTYTEVKVARAPHEPCPSCQG